MNVLQFIMFLAQALFMVGYLAKEQGARTAPGRGLEGGSRAACKNDDEALVLPQAEASPLKKAMMAALEDTELFHTQGMRAVRDRIDSAGGEDHVLTKKELVGALDESLSGKRTSWGPNPGEVDPPSR